MFWRLTQRARGVVVQAAQEARLLKHDGVDPEHILLGLLREGEGLAASALESCEVTLEQARAQVVATMGAGETVPAGPSMPFTPRAKEALELGATEADARGSEHVATHHLLLGLLGEDEVTARVWRQLGIDVEQLRELILSRIDDASEEAARRSDGLFSSFTGSGLRALTLACEEAIELRHDYVGTEHVLLSLGRRGEGPGFRLLESLGITPERVSEQIEVGPDRPPADAMDFTAHASKLIELAKDEAEALGDTEVGTQHLLLGLVRENCVGAQMLFDLGADPEQIRSDVGSR